MASKAQKFSQAVETFAAENSTSYFDSLEHHCDLAKIEYSYVKPLITQSLKDKLELEAQDLHQIPKTSKLPVLNETDE